MDPGCQGLHPRGRCLMPKFSDIRRFSTASYDCHQPWWYIEEWIVGCNNHPEPNHYLDLDPPYQRGHVWTPEQQSAYIEFALQGGYTGRDIYFNCSTWMNGFSTPIEIVDGKQRLTAVRRFMAGEIPAFGHPIGEYEDKFPITSSDAAFNIHVNNLKTRAEVIQWYLDLNFTGTPHTPEELDRVRKLLKAKS